MISCIPEYWILSGTLRLGVRQDRSHAIESFTSDNTESQGYKSDFGALSEFALGEGIDHGLRNDFFIIIVDLQVLDMALIEEEVDKRLLEIVGGIG